MDWQSTPSYKADPTNNLMEVMSWPKVYSLVFRLWSLPWTHGPNNQFKWKLKVSFHSKSQASHRLASAMRIVMETWLGLTLWRSGRVCDIRSQVAHVQLLWTPTKFVGLLRGMETKNAGSQCSFVLEVQFWSYSSMWEVAKCDMHNHGIL